MQRLLVSITLLAAAAALAAQWKPIQPEASLAGWSRVPIPPGARLDPKTQWSTTPGGTLLCDGAKDKGHEWLRYDRELKDFVLWVEWRFFIADPDKGYNSGVFVRNSRDGAVWFQAQAGGTTNTGYFFWDEVVNGEKKRVSLKDQVKNPQFRDPGEWNSFEIRAEGKHIRLNTNGILTSEFDCPRLTGYIGLEAEHYKVEFRNLRIQELP